jgi:hypothetical protein
MRANRVTKELDAGLHVRASRSASQHDLDDLLLTAATVELTLPVADAPPLAAD